MRSKEIEQMLFHVRTNHQFEHQAIVRLANPQVFTPTELRIVAIFLANELSVGNLTQRRPGDFFSYRRIYPGLVELRLLRYLGRNARGTRCYGCLWSGFTSLTTPTFCGRTDVWKVSVDNPLQGSVQQSRSAVASAIVENSRVRPK